MKKILDRFVNLLFPKFCLGCKKEGVWLCSECKKTLKPLRFERCPWCNRVPTVCGFLCQECKSKSKISQLASVFDYKQELVEKIVIHLKYASVRELAEFMAGEITGLWKKIGKKDTNALVVPIPLHSHRLRERGFNQAEHIAKAFARSNDYLCAPHVLVRTRPTKPQVELSREERLKNVEDVFAVRDKAALKAQTVILIDDVCTTGATVQEAAEALIESGAQKVIVLTFARG